MYVPSTLILPILLAVGHAAAADNSTGNGDVASDCTPRCLSSEKVCGDGCIPGDATCCPDALGGIPKYCPTSAPHCVEANFVGLKFNCCPLSDSGCGDDIFSEVGAVTGIFRFGPDGRSSSCSSTTDGGHTEINTGGGGSSDGNSDSDGNGDSDGDSDSGSSSSNSDGDSDGGSNSSNSDGGGNESTSGRHSAPSIAISLMVGVMLFAAM